MGSFQFRNFFQFELSKSYWQLSHMLSQVRGQINRLIYAAFIFTFGFDDEPINFRPFEDFYPQSSRYQPVQEAVF